MNLYFITGNKGKLKEAQEILPNIEGIDLDLDEVQEMDPQKIITNKLKEATKNHKGEFFIEDTSLYIECLNGFPGPLIKWMLESLGNEGIYELVSKYENNKCRVKTVVGYSNGKDIHFFTGELDGRIVEPKGDKDFGWGPIFLPDGYDKTFAQMDGKEKHKISMRAFAFRKLQEYLNK